MSPTIWTRYLAKRALSAVVWLMLAERVLVALVTTYTDWRVVSVKLIRGNDPSSTNGLNYGRRTSR